tara:strand:+ start:59487 stop:60803 length:1317 start_codon:yes stop_codon:yes gene_type:complete
MKSKVIEINKYFLDNKINSMLLSISGGVDSIVLLDILLKVKQINKRLNISLFHTNYNFHNKSNHAELLCKEIASKYNMKLHLLSAKLEDNNFEHNARIIRYNELIKLINNYKYGISLTAHTYDDQIETLLMKDIDNANWISRQGVRSLNNSVYRPLLNVNKNEIYNYAKLNNLEWVEDETNNDLSFKRNKVRYLINKNRYRSSYFNYLQELKKYSDKKYLEYLNKFKINKENYLLRKSKYFVELDIKFLNLFSSLESKLFINYIVLNTFKEDSLKISKSHWSNIDTIIRYGRNGLSINLTNRVLLQKERSSIIISIPRSIQDNIFINDKNDIYNWYDSKISFKSLDTNDNNIVSLKLIDNGSYISHWEKGDKIKLKNSTKKISDIFIDNKISNYDKLYYPILRSNNGNVICVPNLATMYYNEFDKSKCVSLQILNRGG